MGQVLHGSATTTHAVRAAIQRSTSTIAEMSDQYGVNPKTILKWRNRTSVEDRTMGPREVPSTVLCIEEEALCVAFRKHTLLPLDDCLYALQTTIPHLTRSSLHRLFQRHDISRLPCVNGSKPKKRFKSYPIGYFHVDIAEVRTSEGKLHMFVAIDRTSKFAFVELHKRATRQVAKEFLERLIKAVPYKIHTVLTDNGVQFTDPKGESWSVGDIKEMLAEGKLFRCVGFDLVCAKNDIGHRLTKPNHPWTNGQVERMSRTLNEATVRQYYYETHDQLTEHIADFVNAYNFAKRASAVHLRTKYGSYWPVCAARIRLLNFVARKALPRVNIIHGRRNSWRPGRSGWLAILLVKPTLVKYKTCVVKHAI